VGRIGPSRSISSLQSYNPLLIDAAAIKGNVSQDREFCGHGIRRADADVATGGYSHPLSPPVIAKQQIAPRARCHAQVIHTAAIDAKRLKPNEAFISTEPDTPIRTSVHTAVKVHYGARAA